MVILVELANERSNKITCGGGDKGEQEKIRVVSFAMAQIRVRVLLLATHVAFVDTLS